MLCLPAGRQRPAGKQASKNMFQKRTYVAKGVLLSCFILAAGIFFVLSTPAAKAEETTTTFPVNEAGMAAYVKLDSIDITDLTEALNYFNTIKKQGKTYVLGTIEVANRTGNQYPNLYIGLDGWMVAYFSRGEESSRMMQWKNYTGGLVNTTVLKDAIDKMAANIGVSYSTSTDIKYYHFGFPEATKMAVIIETTTAYATDSFSLTIPSTPYEVSYSIFGGTQRCDIWRCWHVPIVLKVDDNKVFYTNSSNGYSVFYGFYDLALLEVYKPHFITFTSGGDWGGAATVLIYKN